MSKFKLPQKLRNVPRLEKELKTKSETYWLKRGERMALRLFQQMAERVPAYKDFLKKNNLRASSIKTVKDFENIPAIDKDNYLRKYPIEQLVWDGNLKEESWVFASTSGSTGEPFYFPRQDLQDSQYAVTAELYLRSNFKIHERSTLYINGFAMGAWIGGLFTYAAIKKIAESGNYHLSVVTPGTSRDEILKEVIGLAPHYDQVLIGGYPPFVKDVIDSGIERGLNWADYSLGIIFSAEGFSEKFRDYIIEKAELKNSLTSTLNHYGTVDLGTMSHETPLAILLRRMGMEDKQVYKTLFMQETKLPTLTQFIPELFYFEGVEGKLFCSAFSGIPLVRYDLKDNGRVFGKERIAADLENLGINLNKKITEAKIYDTIWNLPFVHVYERDDLSVSFYGANIYPETIHKALQLPQYEKHVTGKFTMLIRFDKEQNQCLEINIELRSGVNKSLRLTKRLQGDITKMLLTENSEYSNTHIELGSRALPLIALWEHESPTHFKAKGKQKWVKK